MNEHLKNAHKLEKKMEHGKKTTLSSHQTQFQTQETQSNRHVMTPNKFQELKVHTHYTTCVCGNFEEKYKDEKRKNRP